MLAAGFDIISVIGGSRRAWAAQLWHAGTFLLIAGLAICLVTMLTGFADLVRFGERRQAVVRTMAVHVCVQAGVFMVGVADVAIRIADYHRASSAPPALLLTVVAAVGVCTGAFFGGTLVYRHGHGVAVGSESGRAPLGPDRGEPVPAGPVPAETLPPTATVRAGRVRPRTRHRVHGG